MFVISCRQKVMPALTVRAVATSHPTTQTAPTVRLKVLRPLADTCCHAFCFGYVIPHGSLLYPASLPPFSRHHFTSFRCPHFRFVWAMSHTLAITPRLQTPLTQRKAHSVPFLPPSVGKLAVHRLPLLCSPALSSGLRPVIFFAKAMTGFKKTF